MKKGEKLLEDIKKDVPKAPKTIKVATLVKAIVIIVSLIAMFMLGWVSNDNYANGYDKAVKNEARTLIKDLK